MRSSHAETNLAIVKLPPHISTLSQLFYELLYSFIVIGKTFPLPSGKKRYLAPPAACFNLPQFVP
jgi:hypothetical protein